MKLTVAEINEIKKKVITIKLSYDDSLDKGFIESVKIMKKFGGFDIGSFIQSGEPKIKKISWEHYKKETEYIKNTVESLMEKEEFKNNPKDYKDCLYTAKLCTELISLFDKEIEKYATI